MSDLRERVALEIATAGNAKLIAWPDEYKTYRIGVELKLHSTTDAVIAAVIEALAAEAERQMGHVGYWTSPDGDYIECGLADWLRGHIGDTEATDG